MLNVVSALQASIAPVTLISGVGFLSLLMSNRFGRVIDRMRVLIRQIHTTEDLKAKQILRDEVNNLYRRANKLRIATLFGGGSIFFTALTIFLIFANLMFELSLDMMAEISFLLSLVFLLLFALIFIYDFSISFRAIKFEIDYHLEGSLESRVALDILPKSEEP